MPFVAINTESMQVFGTFASIHDAVRFAVEEVVLTDGEDEWVDWDNAVDMSDTTATSIGWAAVLADLAECGWQVQQLYNPEHETVTVEP